jgi:trypsin
MVRGGTHGRGIAALACCAAIVGLGAGSAAAAPESKRIVGGFEADPADWPYATALFDRGAHLCGATVISPDAVLTAAHCVIGTGDRSLRVVTGRADLGETAVGWGTRSRAIHAHRDYRKRRRHDVAVIRLREDTGAPPATLPTRAQAVAQTAVGATLRVAGWGATKPNGGGDSDVLLETSQHVIRAGPCRRAFFYFHAAEELCTRGDEISDDHHTTACYGDSGGPLIADADAEDLVVGVVSYGGFRCGVREPTVYSRVGESLGFIRNRAGL